MVESAFTLPDNVAELQKIVVDLSAENAAQKQKIEHLCEQLRLLKAALFAPKTEKRPAPKCQPELPFFDEAGEVPAEAEEEEEAPAADETVTVPEHQRRKRGRKPLPEELPREIVVHDIPEAEKVCVHGQERPVIGEEVSEQLEVVPAQVKVIRNVRLVYGGCPLCGGTAEDGPGVVTAAAPEQLIPKGLPTAGTLSQVVVAKFVDATPLYRQEEQFHRLGIELGRGTMCGWVMQTAAACRCLMDLLAEELRQGPVIQIDETTVQVLKEPGRTAQQSSYMWVFRGGPPGRPVLIYQYRPTRSGTVAAEMLGDYQGYVQTDGFSGYDFLDKRPGVTHLGCLVHVRRKFVEAQKASGPSPGAVARNDTEIILKWIGNVYKIEEEVQSLAPDWAGMAALRGEREGPVLEKIHARMKELVGRTTPQGLLGKAVRYGLDQWLRVIRYLEDGRLRPDNNLIENAIRPFVVGRRNWLFYDRPEGAVAGAILYSLIETAKANGLDPFSYLRHVFERLPSTRTQDERRALLPWNVDRSQLLRPHRATHEFPR